MRHCFQIELFFENHLMEVKTHTNVRYSIQLYIHHIFKQNKTKQNGNKQKKNNTHSDNIITIINAIKLEGERYPRHFAFDVSIEFGRANEDERENFSFESHYVTIELCASMKID